MITKNILRNTIILLVLSLTFVVGSVFSLPPTAVAASSSVQSSQSSVSIVNSFRSSFDKSLADTIVGRAIWYMEYGNIVYGHTKYASTGYCDCSQFVSMVYKDFGYSITTASRNYNKVGVQVTGVSVKNGTLVGADKLKPGDIFTFQRTDHITHVAIYIGIFNGKPCFIGTTSGFPTAIGIVSGFNNWYGTQFHGVRRVLPDSAYAAGGKINDRGPVIPSKYRMTPIRPIVMPKDLPTGF